MADGLQGSGTVLPVIADGPPADVTIRLIATGVVTGYVRDVSGRPLAGVEMQLLAPAYDSTGGRSLSPAAGGRTNDRGEYRIYWVTPGRYYLAAGASRMPPGALGRSPNVGWEEGVTFHPGVWDPAQAELITIRRRVELNVDLAVSRNRFEVRGLVVDMETGQRPPHVHVELQPARAVTGPAFLPLRPAGAAYNPADGTFGMRDVPPGRSYATGTVPGPDSLVRRSRPVPLVVSGADLDGIVIALESTVSIPGRARMDDGAPLPAASAGAIAQLAPGVQFPLVSLQASSGGQRLPDMATGIRGGAPAADGTFTLEDVLPGEYRLSFRRRLEYADHYVKEARYGDADALHAPIVVDASRPQTLEIVLSARTGGIAGIVLDAGGRPCRRSRSCSHPTAIAIARISTGSSTLMRRGDSR